MADHYDDHKRNAAARQAELSREGREIGNLPPVKNHRRREDCQRNFRLFCEIYFRAAFPLAWSPDHLRVLELVELATLDGGLFALAMPRGSGKTTICTRAVIWAVLYGHHLYAMLISADDPKAQRCLANIQLALETNPLLFEDFPEVIYPIRCLERIANRTKGQTYQGEPTLMSWTKDKLVLPTIPGSPASGAIIGSGGITSAVRGALYERPDGTIIRPSLVLPDDPQTRASAKSPMQCHDREQIISADLLGMAGPGEKISALMPCTVIRKGDMADRMLNRELHPAWHGKRCKMLDTFPSDMELWDRYWEILSDSYKNDGDATEATKFYRAHRKAMDAGAGVAWPERKQPEDVSALQHAMNIYYRDPEAFASEYQNEPLDEEASAELLLTADEIVAKLHPLKRRAVPLAATHITSFVDVQGKMLWWLVCAWADDFSGWILDYGAWPEQQRGYYTLADAKRTLAKKYPGRSPEGQIKSGLDELHQLLLEREWLREDGAVMHIDKGLVDANWGESTDMVYQFCREQSGQTIMPSHGRGIRAADTPFREYKKKRGDQVGQYWRVPSITGKRVARHVLYDTNYWKDFIHARLSMPAGERSGLTLFQARPAEHRMLAEHLCAEFRVLVEAKQRQVNEWKLRPQRPDNHLFDCLVGAAVAAAMVGCKLPEVTQARDKARGGKSARWSELAKSKRPRTR